MELFLAGAGFDRTEPQPATWERLRELFPAEEVKALDSAITAREDDFDIPAPYSLMWRTPEWARETYGWFAPITIPWLAWITGLDIQPKRVIDLGCGPGVHTCFLAKRFPDAEVVGTDIVSEGLSIGFDLAAQLGLSNVRFVEADLTALTAEDLGGQADLVLASTLLADVQPEAFGWVVPPDHWSNSASIATLVRHGSVAGADTIAALLPIGGTYVGLERAPGPMAYANWLGGLVNAGLQPDIIGATDLRFRMFGESERLQLVPATRDTTHLESKELTALVRRQFPSDFTAEDELVADPPAERLWGVEIQVQDSGGSGQTRIQYLRLASGRIVRFESTTRGYRHLLTVSGDPAIFLETEEMAIDSLPERDPTVVAVLRLRDPL